MNQKTFTAIPFLFLVLLMVSPSCKNSRQSQNNDNPSRQQFPEEKNPVDTMVLTRDTFHRELLSNGILEARRKAGLSFDISGELEAIHVVTFMALTS
jgi:hypothetical protein